MSKAMALSAGYQSEQERAIRHLSAAGSDITAEGARYLLRLLDDARSAAASEQAELLTALRAILTGWERNEKPYKLAEIARAALAKAEERR